MGKTLTRRSFLEAGSIGALSLGALSTGMFSSRDWIAEAVEHEAPEKIAHTFHKTHCIGPCALKCTVREGRLALVEPNDWPDEHHQTVCLKGLSEIQHVYSLERIQTPLKRVGERGSGEFVSISWDEALDIIKEKISESKEKYGPESILLTTSGEADMHYPFLPFALGGQYTPYIGVDTGCDNGFAPAFGGLGSPSPTNEVSDWVNSKTIILIGTNYLESNLPDVRWFFEAKEAGAHIVVVDPAFTTTASKADEWIPINPGYSIALLLGMVTVIIDNNWYDERFVSANTSLPFLLDAETGLFVRQNEPASEDETGEENPYLVWDSVSGSLQPYNAEGVVPALAGTYEVAGKKLRPAFEALIQTQKEYTLEWASEKTGIDAEVISNLAKRYATGGPACLSYGYGGPDKWWNADIFGHAAVLTAALTGNIGRSGSGVGYCAHGLISNGAALASWDLPEEYGLIGPFNANLEVPVANMKYVPNDVRALVNLGDAMFLRFGDWNAQRAWLDSLDFILTIDPYYVTSVSYSDIVLPAATRFECRGDYGFAYCVRNHMLLQEKVIEPLYDSKTDFEIDIAISSLFIDPALLPKTLEELTQFQVDNSEDPAMEGITVEALRANNGIMRLNVPDDPVVYYTDQVYPTKSGRLELYYENLVPSGNALPVFEEPQEAYEGNELRQKYPLQFSQPRSKYYVHSQFCDATWIQQFVDPFVELNPIDATARGLSTGDLVEVYNDRGSFQCGFRANEAVRPGTCRSYYGFWEKIMPGGVVQEVTNGALNPRAFDMMAGPVVPFNDTLVEIRKVDE